MAKIFLYDILLAFILVSNVGCKKDAVNMKDVGPIPDGTYYVATWGDDTNPGNFEKPWATWQKAFSTAEAGDIVYFRGGVYFVTQSTSAMVSISVPDGKGHNGTYKNPICFFNYPGESPILDGSLRNPTNGWNTGLLMNRFNYVHFKGLTIRYVLQNLPTTVAGGIAASDCSNLIFENMTVHDCGGPGITILGGFTYFPEITSDSTFFINVDSYNNCDATGTAHNGGKGDGFFANNYAGSYYSFVGCRSWNNSDDGFDISGSMFAVIRNCWAFKNGRIDGDGNGFKFGSPQSDRLYTEKLRIVTNNIAAFNKANGFDENIGNGPSYPGTWDIFNNTAYLNYISFANQAHHLGAPPTSNIYRNNISYKPTYQQVWNVGDAVMGAGYVHDHNSWDIPLTITDADFGSLIPEGLAGPRQADGSLPLLDFLKLKEGSNLKGAGTYVGMSEKPDIGIDWDYLKRK